MISKYVHAANSLPSWTIKKSPIHGFGVFATQDFLPGEIVDIGLKLESDNNRRIYYRTTLAKFINHQNVSNIVFKKHGGHPNALSNDYYLVVVKPISENEEMVTNYSDYEALIREESIDAEKAVEVK